MMIGLQAYCEVDKMNIAEYIEQNIDKTSCNIVVPYHKFAKEVGLKDLRTVKEWIESD